MAAMEWVNLTQMTIISTTVGRNATEEMEWPEDVTALLQSHDKTMTNEYILCVDEQRK